MRLNNIQTNILNAFLTSPERPEGTMSLHELRGFLWGITSAPIECGPDEWLPFVFDGDEPNFADDHEEESIGNLLLDLLDEQFDRLEDEESPVDAPEYHWHPDASQRQPLTDWCTGLLKAHFWLQDDWNALLKGTEAVETEDGVFDMSEEVENTLDLAALFADVEGALDEAESPPELQSSLPELAEQLPWIMMNYAECGRLLFEIMEETSQEPFRRDAPKMGRNDPCFCGSGKKFKHCCLNAANDE